MYPNRSTEPVDDMGRTRRCSREWRPVQPFDEPEPELVVEVVEEEPVFEQAEQEEVSLSFDEQVEVVAEVTFEEQEPVFDEPETLTFDEPIFDEPEPMFEPDHLCSMNLSLCLSQSQCLTNQK